MLEYTVYCKIFRKLYAYVNTSSNAMDAKFYQLSVINKMSGNIWRFQQDNDSKHTSYITMYILKAQVITGHPTVQT